MNATATDTDGIVEHTDAATRFRQRAQEKISGARDTLAAGSRRATKLARESATATDEYVHSSPWQAVACAALAGVAVGVLLSRR